MRLPQNLPAQVPGFCDRRLWICDHRIHRHAGPAEGAENAQAIVLQRKRRHPQHDGGNLGVQVWPRAGAVGPKDQVRPSLPVTAHRADRTVAVRKCRRCGLVASGRAVDVVDEVDEDRGNIASIGEGQHVALTRVGTDRRIGSQPWRHLQNSKPASRRWKQTAPTTGRCWLLWEWSPNDSMTPP